MTALKKTYFPAVDGLRTVAVLLVVIFHANKTWLPGGFIGVDVFFVISGFLITRNIVAEIQAESWSFSNFYIRRVARLFPALYATIIVTLIAGYFILNPIDLERLGHVSIFTILSGSNIFFWMESGYFDVSADVKPLLHTWSLAVEEQFYLVWPLLIFLLYKFRQFRSVILGLVALGVVSFIAAMIVQSYDPTAVFFLTPFRAYQFALGGVIGLIGLSRSPGFGQLVFLIGLISVLALSYIVDGTTGHFLAATIPAIAATAVIFGSNAKIPSLILGNQLMVWLGQRSYSIYLVHWPLMVLWKIKVGSDFGVTEGLLSIVLSILLGALLHYLVESPFRFRKHFSDRVKGLILTGIVFSSVGVLVTGAHYWAKDGYPGRVPDRIAQVAEIGDSWVVRQAALRDGACNLFGDFDANEYDVAKCATVDPNKPSFLIIGDSFASDTYLVMKEAYPEVHFLQMTLPGCQLRLPMRFKGNNSLACKELYGRAFEEYVRQPGLRGVILASNWEKGHYYRVDDITKLLADTDLKFFVVGQHIRFERPLPSIILESVSIQDARENAKNAIVSWPFEINDEMRNRFGDRVQFVDFISLQCDPDCKTIDDRTGKLYLDDSHISLAGADYLSEQMSTLYPDLFE